MSVEVEALQSIWLKLGLDHPIKETFAEAFCALALLGVASVVLAVFSRRRGASQGLQKAKRPLWRDDPQQVCKRKHDRVLESETDALVSAVKDGKASKLPELIDAALQRCLAAMARLGAPSSDSEAITCQLLSSALRACAASHSFSAAMAAYEHFAGRIGKGTACLWSVLLFHVVETRAFHYSEFVLKRLWSQAGPSPPTHDFVNMVRCHAAQQDKLKLRQSLKKLCISGRSVDTYTWNRALGACGKTACALDLAEELLSAGICNEDIDAVGYNTLMKYNARAGKIARCFELREEMKSKCVEASEVTFGILLDACVSSKDLERARVVFSELCSSGLRLNVLHCTCFMKVLVNAHLMEEAAGVLFEMLTSPGGKPDLLTFSVMIKAYAESGEVSSALKMLDVMTKENIEPDEVLFNHVLTACATFPLQPSEVTRTFETLMRRGMKPTTTTLSILLKGLAQSGAWAACLQVLKDAPERFRIVPEARLYSQVAQSCVRAGDLRTVLLVFEAMLEAWHARGRVAPHKEAVRLFLRACLLGGAPDMVADMRRALERYNLDTDAEVDKLFKNADEEIAAGRYLGGGAPAEVRSVCRHFLLGRCERGAGCRFSHEAIEIEGEAS